MTYKYESEDGNLGDLPTVIVVPTHLLDQWIASLHSALRWGAFDLMLYTGTCMSRGDFVKAIYDKSNQPPHRRIILATASVSLLLV